MTFAQNEMRKQTFEIILCGPILKIHNILEKHHIAYLENIVSFIPFLVCLKIKEL